MHASVTPKLYYSFYPIVWHLGLWSSCCTILHTNYAWWKSIEHIITFGGPGRRVEFNEKPELHGLFFDKKFEYTCRAWGCRRRINTKRAVCELESVASKAYKQIRFIVNSLSNILFIALLFSTNFTVQIDKDRWRFYGIANIGTVLAEALVWKKLPAFHSPGIALLAWLPERHYIRTERCVHSSVYSRR